jgi:hypothetical protein
MNNNKKSQDSTFVFICKNGIWLVGITAWLFGATDISIAVFSDVYLSALDIVQLLTTSFFLISCLSFKRTQSINN